MNICWVLADSAVLDPTQDLEQLKQIGPFWGSWKTWRAYSTDNVICHDQIKANELLTRAFQVTCNFYIPNQVYEALDQPKGVHVYQGDFAHDVEHREQIVAMHLAASRSDIVLLLGFDLARPDSHMPIERTHYHGLVSQVIKDNAQTQWVLIDHDNQLDPDLAKLPNLTQDTVSGVIGLLAS